jgi:secreted PhoX family phosphatase
LSCEESSATQTTTDALGNVFKHGYVFDVPAFGITGYNSTPIPEMGRFAHEAVCVDPRNSIVYQTEDGPSAADSAGSGFFRYIPKRYGRLHRGGKLQMMKIKGEPQKNMQFLPASSTIFKVEWVDVPNPDPNVPTQASCFKQGFDAGGASFRRLEGCWFDTDEDKVYFLSTDGGPPSVGTTSNPKGEGQVFVYDPDRRTLQVIYHSENVADCENPDNLVVTPRGGLLLCEDNAGAPINDGERLLGLTLEGEIFTFAKNNLNFTAVGLGNYLRVESGVTYTSDFRQQEWTGDLSPGNSSEWE